MPAAYDYGNLLSTQGGRNYRAAPQKVTTGDFGTADWQGAVAASAQGRAMVQAAEARAAADMATAGMASYGQLASSNVAATAQVGSAGINAYGGKRQAEIAADAAIKQAEMKRFGSMMGGVAALGMGLAPIFMGSGEKEQRIPLMEVPGGGKAPSSAQPKAAAPVHEPPSPPLAVGQDFNSGDIWDQMRFDPEQDPQRRRP